MMMVEVVVPTTDKSIVMDEGWRKAFGRFEWMLCIGTYREWNNLELHPHHVAHLCREFQVLLPWTARPRILEALFKPYLQVIGRHAVTGMNAPIHGH